MNLYVVTHKKIEWNIPFQHKLITVDGYSEEGAINSEKYIEKEISDNRTFAMYKSAPVILDELKNSHDKEHVGVFSYRSYLSTEFTADIAGVHPEDSARIFATPESLQTSWKDKVLLDFPSNYELVITQPIDFECTVLEQYAAIHHVDDLLFGMGLAVRAGLISQQMVAYSLSNRLFINNFASEVSFYRNLYERVWWIAEEFYKKYWIPRNDYQVRAINFMLERVISAVLIEQVYFRKRPTIACKMLLVDKNLKYSPSLVP